MIELIYLLIAVGYFLELMQIDYDWKENFIISLFWPIAVGVQLCKLKGVVNNDDK